MSPAAELHRSVTRCPSGPPTGGVGVVAALVFVSVASFLGMRLATDAAGGEHCVVGTWVVDHESFLEAYSGDHDQDRHAEALEQDVTNVSGC